MSENFTIAMVDAETYSIVERGQLDRALDELKFQKGDIFDDSTAAALGKMAGAQVVIIASVSYVNNIYFINVRGIDVTTGIVVFGKRAETWNKNELIKITDMLAKVISNGDSSNDGDKKDNVTTIKERREQKKLERKQKKLMKRVKN